MPLIVGELAGLLKIDDSEWQKGINSARQSLEKMARDTGKTLADVGKQMTVKVSAPLAAIAGGAFKLATDFESAFAGVRKTVDASEEQLAELSRGIRDMAMEIPLAATEIAGIAEAAGQLGIQTEHILGFTRVMADLGVATNLSGEQAATALARLANITQMSQQDFDRLGSTIVALGNNLATTEAEIVEMGLRIAGAGTQIGLTEAQILGFAGALSSVGIEAEAGGSAISRVMIQIANEVASGGEKLELFADVAGMTVDEFRKAFQEDAAGAIVTFIEGLARMSSEGENVFAVLDELGLSEIRVRDALLRASGAGDLFRQSIELASEAWRENTALTAEAEQRYATTESQLTLLWNRVKDVGITLGGALIPAFISAIEAAEPLIRAVEQAAQWFANLDSTTRTVIIALGGLVAAIGPLLVVAGTLISSVGTIIGILPTLGAAFTALTGPIGLVVAAVTAAIAIGVALYQNWDEIVAGLREMWERFSGFFSGLWDGIKASVKNAFNGIIAMINRFIGFLNSIKIRVPSINIPFVGQVGGFEIGLPKIPEIPMLAEGGIVTRPTLAMIGEAGPEAVIPLDRGGVAAAGIGPITINVYGSVGVEDIAERLVREIRLRTPIR